MTSSMIFLPSNTHFSPKTDSYPEQRLKLCILVIAFRNNLLDPTTLKLDDDVDIAMMICMSSTVYFSFMEKILDVVST